VERQQQRFNRSYPCASTLSSSCGAVAHALLFSAGIRSPRATRLARPYVESVDDTLERVSAQGGAPVEAPYAEGDLRVATFRDPAGNVIGVWQRGSHG
jgi:predicted enzyme related to lactoylglutathione lyase